MKKKENLPESINIGGALEHFRAKLGLNKKEFAQGGGISPSHYSEILSGLKTPTIAKLKEFCSSYGIPFHFFVFMMMEKVENKSEETMEYLDLMKKSVDKINQLGFYYDSKFAKNKISKSSENTEVDINPLEIDSSTSNFDKSSTSTNMKKKLDLPLDNSNDEETNDDNTFKSSFDKDLEDIDLNDDIKVIPVLEFDKEGKTRYSLDDYMELENQLAGAKSKAEEFEPKIVEDELVFEKRIIAKNPNITQNEVDPMETPLEELLKERADERRRKLKDFNFKFQNNSLSNIDGIEKEVTYKRQGIDLNDKSAKKKSSSTSLDVDTNVDSINQIQLRSNNTFLHDNVD